jgi:hypothetical protein
MRIQAAQVPVSGVDRAKDFHSDQPGFNLDVDRVVPGCSPE